MGTRQTIRNLSTPVLSDSSTGWRHMDMLAVGKLYRARKNKEKYGERIATLRSPVGNSITDITLQDVFLVLDWHDTRKPGGALVGNGWHLVLVGDKKGWIPIYDTTEWEEVKIFP